MANENGGAAPAGGGNSGGLVGIASTAKPPADGEKRGRGRPPGSKSGAAGPVSAGAGGVPPVPSFIWNAANAGALTRPPFALAALLAGIKELALSPDEEAALIPAMIPVYQEFFPYMSPKIAAAIGGLATLGPILASKYSMYRKAQKAEPKKEPAKTEGAAK